MKESGKEKKEVGSLVKTHTRLCDEIVTKTHEYVDIKHSTLVSESKTNRRALRETLTFAVFTKAAIHQRFIWKIFTDNLLAVGGVYLRLVCSSPGQE